MRDGENEIVTPDDPAVCEICGHQSSLAMILTHLNVEHGIEVDELATAPIIDLTTEREEDE